MEHTTFAEVNKRPQLERLVSHLESFDEIAVDVEVQTLNKLISVLPYTHFLLFYDNTYVYNTWIEFDDTFEMFSSTSFTIECLAYNAIQGGCMLGSRGAIASKTNF